MATSPEANSFELTTYSITAGTRQWVELANYHSFWITCFSTITTIKLYLDETDAQFFPIDNGAVAGVSPPNGNAVMFHSEGARWITGQAGFWIDANASGYIYVMGIRRT